ncbi:hypothetical protein ABRY77_16345 [Enterococcus casseliflavus]|uniref:hypothetical protein n=1 Tax=Enterococcus casseliflavus TaxID=37734 RepID=UPI003EE1C5FB
MELDHFRDVDLVIDYANYSFIEKQFVSQGDYKGRTLTVQVTNNGVVGEVPGLMLNLNWYNEASGLADLSAFSVLDKANSIYRIEYPQHMMTPGRVIASIQVIQNGKVTNLKQFELTVQRLAGQPVGIVQKAEFSALVAVLADSNKFRTDINDLGDKKVDKNGASQVTWSMVSQEVREKILGDSAPATVGVGAVLDENVVNGAIGPLKTSFIKTGKNLHDKSKIIDGYYLDKDNDVLIANASNFVTEYIYIGTNLPVSINILNSNLVGVINYCIYDLSKQRLRGGQLTKTNSNPFTMGTDGYYLRLSAYKDYKTNLQVEIGSSSTDYESFYMQMDPKIKVTQEVVTDVFDPTEIGLNVSSEGFDLYVKGSKSEENLYFKYPIKKAVKDYVSGDYSSNYDTFNIVGGFKASRNNNLFSTGEKIVQNGEWEMAIKENGANDFIGGIAHGDEKLTAFAAFLDGKYISLDQSGTFLGREFVLECFSDLYRDTSITSGQLIKIAKHYKKYIFTKDGLLLQQRIEWIADVTLDNAYLCMLPIKRKTNDDNSGANITTNAMTANLINYDISESGWTSDLRTPTHGRERINMWGSDSGVSVFIENNPAPSLESSLGFVQNTVTYNKYYFDFSGSKSVKTGDIWENNTVFKIDVRNA